MKKIKREIKKEVKKDVDDELVRILNNPKKIDNAEMIRGMAVANSNFRACLENPKLFLARTPQSTSKTIVAKIVRNFTVTTNALGNCCFVFIPQAINDSSNIVGSTSPFWFQNAATYTPTVIENVVGYVGVNVGSIINASFSSARCLSARIELVPNLSLTSAVGRGIIAMSKFKTLPIIMSTVTSSTTNYQQLQLQDTMMACSNLALADLNKMQGLAANWVPHEGTDLLDYPAINFSQATDLQSRHPTENFVFGLFTGLPAATTINVRTWTNVELLPDSSLSTSGLFPLIAEYGKERNSPIEILRDVCIGTPNFCSTITINN